MLLFETREAPNHVWYEILCFIFIKDSSNRKAKNMGPKSIAESVECHQNSPFQDISHSDGQIPPRYAIPGFEQFPLVILDSPNEAWPHPQGTFQHRITQSRKSEWKGLVMHPVKTYHSCVPIAPEKKSHNKRISVRKKEKKERDWWIIKKLGPFPNPNVYDLAHQLYTFPHALSTSCVLSWIMDGECYTKATGLTRSVSVQPSELKISNTDL